MGKFKFELNRFGVRELLQSSEMLEICRKEANAIKEKAGDGYEVSVMSPGKTRVNASVEAKTVKARRDNAQNNTLLKAVRR